VFLDEIGELPLALQAKLLALLETREVTPLGALGPRAIDVRFVAATNRRLEDDVQAGGFRKDLFFRLSGFSLFIPPLRARPLEIAPLAEVIVKGASRRLGREQAPALSPEALARLERHGWPGNVRELRNTMERAVLLCRDPHILPHHLDLETDTRADTLEAPALLLPPPAPRPSPEIAAPAAAPVAGDEKQRIEQALAACGGNQSRAAKQLGMPRSTFILRLEAYGIVRPRKHRSP
jgi:two-component system response regulator AtoC